MATKNNGWVVQPQIPEELYTDRIELEDSLYQWCLNTGTRRSTSLMLLGRRRMGKTELFKRLVNRLFLEQNPKKPKAVVPVYYSFPEIQEDKIQFCKIYLENFLRFYVGFYTSDSNLPFIDIEGEKLLEILKKAEPSLPSTTTVDWMIYKYRALVQGSITAPIQSIVELLANCQNLKDIPNLHTPLPFHSEVEQSEEVIKKHIVVLLNILNKMKISERELKECFNNSLPSLIFQDTTANKSLNR